MPAEQGTNQSVERASSVLAAFLGAESLRVSDVASETGLGQSTTSRLLATLESLEYVERDPVSGLYRLGPALITLGGAALNQDPIARAARQRAQELAAALGLGVNVAVRRSAALFYLCNFEGLQAGKAFTMTGQTNPLHATGLGKCLLLDLTAERRRTLLPALQRFTDQTVVEHDHLDELVEAVRRRGYATEVQELALGRACLAAPVLGRSGEVVAALSISGPLSAIDLEHREGELSRAAIEAADGISVSLGYLGPHRRAVDSVESRP